MISVASRLSTWMLRSLARICSQVNRRHIVLNCLAILYLLVLMYAGRRQADADQFEGCLILCPATTVSAHALRRSLLVGSANVCNASLQTVSEYSVASNNVSNASGWSRNVFQNAATFWSRSLIISTRAGSRCNKTPSIPAKGSIYTSAFVGSKDVTHLPEPLGAVADLPPNQGNPTSFSFMLSRTIGFGGCFCCLFQHFLFYFCCQCVL